MAASLAGGEGIEAAELAIRAGLTSLGRGVLEDLLTAGAGYRGPRIGCGTGHQAEFVSYRPKTVDTVLGPVTVNRAWSHCATCGHGLAPRDAELGVAGETMSPGLAKMAARAAEAVPFTRGAGLVGALAGITLTGRRLGRHAEADGRAAAAVIEAEAAAIAARTLVPLPPAPVTSAMTPARDIKADGSVHRRKPLPEAPARGRLIVTEAAMDETATALRAFRGRHGRHEGIVFWAGRQCGTDTVVAAALLPRAEHGPGFVHVSHAEVGWMARSARRLGLAVMAQVHSHPGGDTRHSDGDDELIVLPREGMFSLVVGRYGDGPVDPCQGAGLHQFQDGRWVRVKPAEGAFITVTAAIRP